MGEYGSGSLGTGRDLQSSNRPAGLHVSGSGPWAQLGCLGRDLSVMQALEHPGQALNLTDREPSGARTARRPLLCSPEPTSRRSLPGCLRMLKFPSIKTALKNTDMTCQYLGACMKHIALHI